MKNFCVVLTGFVVLLSFVACGNNNNEFRNIEQIQESEGIPVKVEQVSLQPFSISLTYNANLSGFKETTLTSVIAERVEKIHVRVGDHVEKDDLLISFPEDNPSAQYIQAKAAYENALQTYQRMSVLLEQGGISRQELDQLQTAKRVNKANMKASEKMIRIRAPYSGTITHLNLRESESAGHGEPLLTIARIDEYQTKIWVTENDIHSITPGLQAIARWQDYELPGRVIQVARSIDRNRQAFAVDLQFENPGNFLLTGVMVTLEVFRYENPEAVIVPRHYVMSDQQGNFVYLAREERAIKRYVETGESDGFYHEIVEGLEEGDPLITEGAAKVEADTSIRIVE